MQRKDGRRVGATGRRAARWLLGPLAAVGLLAIPAIAWLRPLGTTSGPAPEAHRVSAAGPAQVGAAAVELLLPTDSTLAGFGLFRPPAEGRAGPLFARAIALGPLVIVSLDLLEIPRALGARVAQLTGANPLVWLCATHTHSGPGGYDPAHLPQLAGARRFDQATFERLAEAAAEAAREALGRERPAVLRFAATPHGELKRGRSPGATPDPTLWALRATELDGAPIATLVAFGAHPTIVPRRARQLSADWPGAAAAALERPGGVALVVQAIGGDSAVAGPGSADPRVYGEQVAAAAESALASAPPLPPSPIAAAEAPAPVVWSLRELFPWPSHFLDSAIATQVGRAELGGLRFTCLPGEITGAAWADLVGTEPTLGFPMTLCGDELSYVESPRLLAHRQGERLVLFPDGVHELGAALRHMPGM